MQGEVEAIAGLVLVVGAVGIAVIAAVVDGCCYVLLSPLQLFLLSVVSATWC